MRPFFTYFGGKHRLANKITPPQHRHVIEPFAGSAGYCVYHEPQQVTLIEVNPVIAGIWRYLIRSSSRSIMELPVDVDHVEEIRAPEEARWLVGMWFNKGMAAPSKQRSNWARTFQHRDRAMVWSEAVRLRIACQVDKIRHWRIIEGDYTKAPNVDAHWHIDPPYVEAGKAYKHHAIDYGMLAEWCQSRKGFVQVCEGGTADWLPFRELPTTTKGSLGRARKRRSSVELIHEFGRMGPDLFSPPPTQETAYGTRTYRN